MKKRRRLRITDKQTGESIEREVGPLTPRGPRTKREAEEQRRDATRRVLTRIRPRESTSEGA